MVEVHLTLKMKAEKHSCDLYSWELRLPFGRLELVVAVGLDTPNRRGGLMEELRRLKRTILTLKQGSMNQRSFLVAQRALIGYFGRA